MPSFYETLLSAKCPYIIAEIGSNHNGDMNIARELINRAKECGADCVKFQSFDDKSLVSSEEYDRNQKYTDSSKKHFGSLKEMVVKYYLRKEQHHELKSYCLSKGIEFASTPFSNEEVDLLITLNVPFLKIASMDIDNQLFIEYIGLQKKPIVLSTGMSTLGEIERAIKVIENTGNHEIILLHCISIYPPQNKDIHLNNLIMLKKTFNYPIGFSDHTIGTSIPLAATALGVKIIEKHFTIDKNLPGWDHEISADPAELAAIVRESKIISDALGSFTRTVSAAEEEKKKKFRRSIVVKKSLNKGHVLTLEDIVFKRPGTGIKPDEYKYILGRELIRDYKEDELIHWEDLA